MQMEMKPPMMTRSRHLRPLMLLMMWFTRGRMPAQERRTHSGVDDCWPQTLKNTRNPRLGTYQRASPLCRSFPGGRLSAPAARSWSRALVCIQWPIRCLFHADGIYGSAYWTRPSSACVAFWRVECSDTSRSKLVASSLDLPVGPPLSIVAFLLHAHTRREHE